MHSLAKGTSRNYELPRLEQIRMPIPLRYSQQTNRRLYSKVHARVMKDIHQYDIKKAHTLGIKKIPLPVQSPLVTKSEWPDGDVCGPK
jgi:hypothetical protein